MSNFAKWAAILNNIKPVAKNLGVWFHNNLNFEQHTTRPEQLGFII